MLLFPYRTDAPVYHFPVATIGLIVVNVIAFVALLGSSGDVQSYILQYGEGLKPLQWVTSNFVHGGLMHLFGNMIALWTFGFLVEGKVGPLVFLPLYLGMGFVQCGLEQAVMSGAGHGGSFGASAILFGLMAIALIWSPRNDVGVAGLLVFRPVNFDAPIVVFCGLMFIWELILAGLVGFTVSTAVLHISGAVIGLLVGTAFVKLNWVDCEGWDLFSVMSGTVGEKREPERKKKKKKKKSAPADKAPRKKWPPE
ncbi:MAG: Rhomboid family protein [Gemmataceae bacterium]|nr:Rhomboid family protein [Gemmataceae bacterium]